VAGTGRPTLSASEPEVNDFVPEEGTGARP
jgi:hypothetical protein